VLCQKVIKYKLQKAAAVAQWKRAVDTKKSGLKNRRKKNLFE